MYDDFSEDYDRFVNWDNRLALELPFIEKQINSLNITPGRPINVLDTACGTGMHAIALERRGYKVVGADSSDKMIQQARENTASSGVEVEFAAVGFQELAQHYKDVDVILCLGNSLPHVLTPSDLSLTLNEFASCLRPNGLLLIQNRNFDAVMAKHERWMEPQSYREESKEWIFLRLYDFDEDGLLTFHMITLSRSENEEWRMKANSTRLNPIRRDEMLAFLRQSGFGNIVCYGGMEEKPFIPEESGNLVVVARKLETPVSNLG